MACALRTKHATRQGPLFLSVSAWCHFWSFCGPWRQDRLSYTCGCCFHTGCYVLCIVIAILMVLLPRQACLVSSTLHCLGFYCMPAQHLYVQCQSSLVTLWVVRRQRSLQNRFRVFSPASDAIWHASLARALYNASTLLKRARYCYLFGCNCVFVRSRCSLHRPGLDFDQMARCLEGN